VATVGENLSVDADDVAFEEAAANAWFEDDGAGEIETGSIEYDITSSPNDFNVRTIVDFVGSGSVKIPGFQRNYVWDIRRASRLVESLLIGLPIPQVFLYEERRNSFLVIDGQQRLMSIFYFAKGRFLERRSARPCVESWMQKVVFRNPLWKMTNTSRNSICHFLGKTESRTPSFTEKFPHT
jgi:hypothetical protein